ncbi:neutral/alkaline non-lysosomal ceramidase N-terminal domain-containing protein [Myxococcota bacterium]|nr:neutral/alkaline non-lysosomal ceramidase N-terminal domain-containing protein [Myxococcota bacterium]
MPPAAAPLRLALALLVPALALAGCGEGDPADDDTVSDDDATGDDDTTPPPEPGPFMAGSAEARLPAPLGIGTAGFNGIGQGPSPTPYAVSFPGTTRIHGHPGIKVLALSRGAGFELVLVRLDMVAVREELRGAVVAEVLARTGRDLDDALVIGATHTHSGPGRFIQGALYEVITDRFFTAFYERLVDEIAGAIVAAFDDLAPAELGTTVVDLAGAHEDRRCEDGLDYVNDAMPMLAVSREGRITDLALVYAIHGTVLGVSDLTLSQDASGGIEEKVEQSFDHPVRVMLLNSWAGDMSPGDPERTPEGPLSPVPSDYERMDRLGAFVADALGPALSGITTTAEPEIAGRSFRYPISRAEIGYGEEEFPYEWGGVYCDSPDATCDEVTNIEDLDHRCIPFPETSPGPLQSMFTVGRVGSLDFVTWGGECTTGLAEKAIATLQQASGAADDVVFFGYANDYMGYQLEEEDWWHGGYEASGSMWGPRQGEYMLERLVQSFAAWKEGAELPFAQPAPAPLYDLTGGEPWVPEEATEVGTIAEAPAASYGPADIATFEVNGADPWWGAPRAFLQREDGAFADVLLGNGEPLDSDSYAWFVDLAPEPGYADVDYPSPRRFAWRFSLALARHAPGLDTPLAGGTFRFRVEVPDGDGGTVEAFSDPFEVRAE